MHDIIVLGATGFTGRLITRYLHAHPEHNSFTFAIAGRSKSKLAQLVADLRLDDSIEVIQVDVTQEDQVEAVVQRGKVFINTVGPYSRWGTPVVRACARQGKHYVDLTGETPWVQSIILQFDYLALKTGAIIIPSCGYDSMPSDICTYLSAKTIKATLGPDTPLGHSATSHKVSGGVSGGTMATAITLLEEAPTSEGAPGMEDYVFSPYKGAPGPSFKLLYTMPVISPRLYGAFFFLAPHNVKIVQRTRGLFEQTKRPELSYGPDFTYEEFVAARGPLRATLLSLGFAFGFVCLTLFAPARWVLKMVAPAPGTGPSDEVLERGWMKVTNITSSAPSAGTPQTHAQTVVRGRGSPGYLLTALMISEAALALLDPAALPALARRGGVLTPMSALGDVLVDRLKATQRFEIESGLITDAASESRKTR